MPLGRWLPLLHAVHAVVFLLALGLPSCQAYDKIVYGSSWGTASAFFFLLSALWSDILLVRLCLVMAYICLLITNLTGVPPIDNWGVSDTPVLSIGGVVWTSVTLILQLWGLGVTLADERPIKLLPEHEPLWRCFLRRCGMKRLEFKQVLKCGRVRTFKAGEVIYKRGRDEPMMNLIVEGVMCLQPSKGDTQLVQLHSGDLCDLRLGNLFGVYLGFELSVVESLVAESDVKLLTWDAAALMSMASGERGAALPEHWTAFLLYSMAREFAQRVNKTQAYCSLGMPEDPSFYSGAPSRDFTRPLSPEETEHWTLGGTCRWILRSLNPIPPPGMRHRAEPVSGMLARQRMLVAAQIQEETGVMPKGLQGLSHAPSSSLHGGNASGIKQGGNAHGGAMLVPAVPATKAGDMAVAAAATGTGRAGDVEEP